MDKALVGRNIKQARKKRHLKQKELAEIIGYTESSISKYEQGLTEIPNSVIELIAKALQVSPLQLLGSEEWDEAFNPNGKLAKEAAALELIEEIYGETAIKLLENFMKLNEIGRVKAIGELEDLTEVPKYQKKNTDA